MTVGVGGMRRRMPGCSFTLSGETQKVNNNMMSRQD